MRLRASAITEWKTASLLVTCLLLGGCSRSADSPPTIVFGRRPKADKGGPDKVDTIEGSVTGAQPAQRIVLYARSEDLWWVQPFTEHSFTEILDFRWKNKTHLGTGYAARLVEGRHAEDLSGFPARDAHHPSRPDQRRPAGVHQEEPPSGRIVSSGLRACATAGFFRSESCSPQPATRPCRRSEEV